jgi:hypothetical protein
MNLFKKQIYHYLTLFLLVGGVFALADDAALSNHLLGVSTIKWLWLSITLPVLHQI